MLLNRRYELSIFNQLRLDTKKLMLFIFWFVYILIMSKAAEMQDGGQMEDNYVYTLDHEFFVNLGRISLMLFILFAFHYWDEKLGLTIVVSAGAIMQAFGLVAARRLIRLQNLSLNDTK